MIRGLNILRRIAAGARELTARRLSFFRALAPMLFFCGGFDQLGDAAPFVPILDVEVAVLVDRAAVGGGEDAVLPVLRWDAEIRALGFNGVVAEDGEDFVVLIEENGAAGEFGDEDEISMDGGRTWAAEACDRNGDGVAIEVEELDAEVFAVADDEKRALGIAGVHRQSMAGDELARFRATGPELAEEFSVRRVFVDEVRAVAVGHKEGAVRRGIDGGGIRPTEILGAGFIVKLENNVAIEVEFADALAPGGVEVFLTALFAHGEAVEAAGGFAPASDKGAVRLINNDAVRAIGGDIDFPGFIDCHATVGGADVFLPGDAAPVEDGLVNPVTLASEGAVFRGRGGSCGGWFAVPFRVGVGGMENGEAEREAGEQGGFGHFCFFGAGEAVGAGAGAGGGTSTPQMAAFERCR